MLCCHDNDNAGLHMCAKFNDHTYEVLYAHCKDICSHHQRLVTIGYEYLMLPE